MKAKLKKKIDGRANPGRLNPVKFAEAQKFIGKVKIDKRLVKTAGESTPVTHQSGKGTRAIREDVAGGTAKVRFMRWCGAHGIDMNRGMRFVFASGKSITLDVARKAYREGENGTHDSEVTDETVKLFKSFK